MIVHYAETIFECSKAFKMEHEVVLCDQNDEEIYRISNIYGDEWNFISVEDGEWTVEPTELEVIRADLDYCLMLLEDM